MSVQITHLRAEYRTHALGLGTSTPRLSWWTLAEAGTQAWAEFSREGDTGSETVRVEGPDQVLVPWPFAPLRSRERTEVRVRIGLSDGRLSPWSDPLPVEAGLLERADWQVPLVVPSPAESHDTASPATARATWLVRADFALDALPVRARLYTTAQGLFHAELNGDRVGDDELAPGWTSYGHRLRAQTYDVTPLLRAGSNTLGIELADGWFRGHIGFDGGVWDLYGSQLGVLAQLEVTDRDGRVRVIDLSDRWRIGRGGIRATGLYEGECFDARAHPDGWSEPGFDAETWRVPELWGLERIEARIEHALGEPVRQIERLSPIAVERRASGRVRLDFGQNIAGRLEITVAGTPGAPIRLHHAEVLEDDELAIRALRAATSIDEYIPADGDTHTWQPRFTIHGFRYAEIEGWPEGEDAGTQVAAVVLHTDMERTGWFEASDPMVTKLHENTVWSMRDNFVDLPTDCPQRDERMGWTGDIQVFAPAATTLFRSGGVLDSWLVDVADEQASDGAVPNFVPWVPCGFPEPSSPAWGDVATVLPWTMWERWGDRDVVARQFASACAWVDHLAARADGDGVIRSGFALGDWLDPAAPPDDPGAARTDRYLVATAYLIRSARLAAQSAQLIGDDAAHGRYRDLAATTLAGFRAAHMRPDGRMREETPTALALLIAWDLWESESERADAGARLAALVAAEGYRIATGFVGTPIICDALAATGQIEAAYRLLRERECPSWLYPVTMGATTIWERWDSMLPDGRVNPGDMTSFNHYALGAVVDFLYRVVGGIAPRDPGYRSIEVAPLPGGGIDHARARIDSPYGPITVAWELTPAGVALELEVPFGTTAHVRLPGEDREHVVRAGQHRLSSPAIESTPSHQEETTRVH